MDNEDYDELIETVAEEFDKYPFDTYTGVEVAEIIRGKFRK